MGILETAWDLGIRQFDCARGYGDAESLLGGFLAGKPRNAFEVASKQVAHQDKNVYRRRFEESLERLQLEFLDTYFIHWPRPGLDLRLMMEVLVEERERGRIRQIGVSNFTVADLEIVREAGPVDVYQTGYHLFWRWRELDVIPYCRENGIRLQAYSPLGQGILTGKFPRYPEFPREDHRRKTVLFRKEVWPQVYEAVEALKPLSEKTGYPMAHLAIQWVLSQPGFNQVVVGARNVWQVRENTAAVARSMDPEILESMKRISDDVHQWIPDSGHFFGH